MKPVQTLPIVGVLCIAALAAGQTFHFTVTADPRGQHAKFADTLAAINALAGGPGVFHLTEGDIDGSIPENRAVIDQHFGADALWYPGIGNHEAETPADMAWLRNEYDNGNGVRTPLKNFTNQDGPASTRETTYTWNYGNTHFVQLNEYWNGSSDTGTNGDVVPALYDWLKADLEANTRPFVFVFGHEPAFPYNRHVGDSLDAHVANRDAFWQLLEDHNVHAYIVGHTHVYSKHQGDKNHVGDVWQIDVGAAGNGGVEVFLDVTVAADKVTYEVYNNAGGTWRMHERWNAPVPEPATAGLMMTGGLALIRRKRRA